MIPSNREFEKDPNADLESFENFGQDFTKSPDQHQDPPELEIDNVSENNYKYIPIGVPPPESTHVPYFETKKPLFSRPLRNPTTDFPFIKVHPKHRIPRPIPKPSPSPEPDYYSEYEFDEPEKPEKPEGPDESNPSTYSFPSITSQFFDDKDKGMIYIMIYIIE